MTLEKNVKPARDTSVPAYYTDMTDRLLRVSGESRMVHFAHR